MAVSYNLNFVNVFTVFTNIFFIFFFLKYNIKRKVWLHRIYN